MAAGKIHLHSVLCEGTESDLFNCTTMPTGLSGTPCEHSEDVGVACTVTDSIRLSEGTSYRQGKLEMLSYSGEWGKVCAQDWGLKETRVACKQLGQPNFGQDDDISFTTDAGSGPYVTGGLNCTGYEDRLDNCTQTEDWAPDSCQEISVTCGPDIVLLPSGVIYMSYGGVVGTICPGENWNINASRVACRNLGHKRVIQTIRAEYTGSFEVILNNPTCSGEETFYTECESAEWAYHGNCISTDVDRAGVICERQEPEVRIRNDSPYPEIGRVEISVRDPNQYMMTCAHAWNISAAHVVCRKLGYDRGAVQIFFIEGATQPDQKMITGLDCPDGVSNLADCTIEITDLESAENCDLDRVAGVACSAADNIAPLVGGSSMSEGVLEYKIGGLPALICDPDWSDKEATVACRMHGYETGNKTEVVSLGHTRDSFPYSFQNKNYTCSGAEESLEECQVELIEDVEICDPDNIVQVTCQPNKDWDLRLVGSDASEQGRVEVFLGGEWGSIKYEGLGVLLPFLRDRVCRQLGYKESIDDAFDLDQGAGGENPFGAGTGKVLRCDTFAFPNGCDDVQSEVGEDEPRPDVSVVCLPYGTVENHPVRLVSETGVANNRTGRVEILHDGEWGSVCESETGIFRSVYRVVCKELGYTDSQYKPLEGEEKEPFLSGDEKIWFTTTDSCFESRLYKCDHGPWGQTPEDCSPSVVTCVPDDDDDDDDDDGDAGPSLLRAHRTGLILGAALMVLLIITV